jgi:hypothetical protein
MIQAYVLISEGCEVCDSFLKNKLDYSKKTWEHQIEWIVVNATAEVREKRMKFPPFISPSIYFYKNKDADHFPLFTMAYEAEPEFTNSVNNAISMLKEIQ